MGSAIDVLGTDARIQGREITFDLQSAQPPINQYISKDDVLFIMTASSIGSAVAVTVFARMLMPDGTLQQNQWTVSAPALRNGFYTPITLPECFLLSCSAVSNASTPGTVYIVATIARGLPTLGFQHLVLFKGYCYINGVLSWPWGVNTTSVDCAGATSTAISSVPALGADISMTVPANAKWMLKSIIFTLTTAAGGGSRDPCLTLDDGSNVFCQLPSPSAIAGAAAQKYCFAIGVNPGTAGTLSVTTALPFQTFLMPGYRIRTQTPGIQPGDQYSAAVASVEEWLLP